MGVNTVRPLHVVHEDMPADPFERLEASVLGGLVVVALSGAICGSGLTLLVLRLIGVL